MQRDTVVARYAIALVARERQRQLAVEGWSETHDDALTGGELGLAAACYAAAPHPLYTGSPEAPVDAWPFAPAQDKRGRHDTVRRLAIAGALLLAELERELRRGGLAEAAAADPDLVNELYAAARAVSRQGRLQDE